MGDVVDELLKLVPWNGMIDDVNNSHNRMRQNSLTLTSLRLANPQKNYFSRYNNCVSMGITKVNQVNQKQWIVLSVIVMAAILVWILHVKHEKYGQFQGTSGMPPTSRPVTGGPVYTGTIVKYVPATPYVPWKKVGTFTVLYAGSETINVDVFANPGARTTGYWLDIASKNKTVLGGTVSFTITNNIANVLKPFDQHAMLEIQKMEVRLDLNGFVRWRTVKQPVHAVLDLDQQLAVVAHRIHPAADKPWHVVHVAHACLVKCRVRVARDVEDFADVRQHLRLGAGAICREHVLSKRGLDEQSVRLGHVATQALHVLDGTRVPRGHFGRGFQRVAERFVDQGTDVRVVQNVQWRKT